MHRQRKRIEVDEGGGDHVIRQPTGEPPAQLALAGRLGPLRDHIGHQSLVGIVALEEADARRDAGVGAQLRLDFAELDAEPPQFDLLIDPSEILEIGAASADQIAAPVQPGSGLAAGRVGDEPARGQLRPAPVAAGESLATDVQLAGNPIRHRVASGIEDREPQVRDGTADRATGG